MLTSPGEKALTRALYEMVFDDPEPYVDYYYREKCSDNLMFALCEENDVLSMLHLNPYRLMVCGKEIQTFCIAAVATKPALRRQGYMAEVMCAALRYMEHLHIPFCYLVPVDPAIYTRFGFESVAPLRKKTGSYAQICQNADIYGIQDAVYQKRREMETALAPLFGADELPEDPVVMGKVTNNAAFDHLLWDKPFSRPASDRERLDLLRKKNMWICDEV